MIKESLKSSRRELNIGDQVVIDQHRVDDLLSYPGPEFIADCRSQTGKVLATWGRTGTAKCTACSYEQTVRSIEI